MRSNRFYLATLLLAFGCASVPTGASAVGFSLFKSIWGDVIINTDMTPEGEKLTPPSREHPVYFSGTSLGCRLGSIPGDALPDIGKMDLFIGRILAKQGYLGARDGQEPSLHLVVQWGMLEPRSGELLWFLGYNPQDDIAAPTGPTLGPEVWRRGFRTRMIETILENARDSIYGIIITAFDHKTVKTDKPVIYWQTRIGLPANGKSMEQALPNMMVAAGPAIGRRSDKPILVDADNVRGGRVTLRDLQILDSEPAQPERAKE